MSPELRAKYEAWLAGVGAPSEHEVRSLDARRQRAAREAEREREQAEHRQRTEHRAAAERAADEVYPIGSLWWVEVLDPKQRENLLRAGLAPVVPALRVKRTPTVKNPPEYNLHRGWNPAGCRKLAHEEARPICSCPIPSEAEGTAAAALLTEDD
jgi:hypothetical protein